MFSIQTKGSILSLILIFLLSLQVNSFGFDLIPPGTMPQEIEELSYYNRGNTVCVTEDELTMVFTDPVYHKEGCEGAFDLWISMRASKDDPWSVPPKNMNLFQVPGMTGDERINTRSKNYPPAISGNGDILVWEDTRSGIMDIWISTRESGSDLWGEAMNIDDYNKNLGGENLNSNKIDGDPAISADGLTLYISTERRGIRAIWIAKRNSLNEPFGSPIPGGPCPMNLDEYNDWLDDGLINGSLGYSINEQYTENPAVSCDGLMMFFMSNRENGFKIWVTTRASTNAPWGPPENIGDQVNPIIPSAAQWGLGYVGDSMSGTLYFCTNTGNGILMHTIGIGSPIPPVTLMR
ncbi:MAG: hypothetical protein AB1797_07720 [bacterium]